MSDRLYCVTCLDTIESTIDDCQNCIHHTGQAPDQRLPGAQRQAVQIVGEIISNDLMDRRDIKWPLRHVQADDYEVWTEIVSTNVATVLRITQMGAA